MKIIKKAVACSLICQAKVRSWAESQGWDQDYVWKWYSNHNHGNTKFDGDLLSSRFPDQSELAKELNGPMKITQLRSQGKRVGNHTKKPKGDRKLTNIVNAMFDYQETKKGQMEISTLID